MLNLLTQILGSAHVCWMGTFSMLMYMWLDNVMPKSGLLSIMSGLNANTLGLHI